MGIHAADGSLNIVLDTVGRGLYSPEGYLRCTDSTQPPGLYEDDGSYRVVFGSPGTGVLDSSGSFRVSTDAGVGLHDKTGAFRVTIMNPSTPVTLYPVSVGIIDGAGSVSNLGNGSYRVTSNLGGSGIRYKFDLSELKINTTYKASFTLSNLSVTQPVMADVCDDTAVGPFTAGAKTFNFSRSSYDNTYRFIDVYCGEDDEEFGGIFTISTLTITEV